ncbi:MAG: 4Fe-4S binding protein [Candidatus Aquicultor sp.]|nr:4Fe-4S binding protein [Candidatus Aquicultor sp.]
MLVAGALWSNRKDSTKALARFHGSRVHDLLHSYFYFRWNATYLKPVKYVLEHPEKFPERIYMGAGRRLMQTHHSKVLSTGTARRLVSIEEPVRMSNSEQVLPFDKARDIILENPGSIAVTECACRKIADDPCGPLDVCLVLGEPFVSFVVEHQKDGARRIDSDEALAILEREHERGRVHTAWFKDAAGDRLYSICNCCSCCCLGLHALSHGFDVVASSGYVAQVDDAGCVLCEECLDACNFGALSVTDAVEIDAGKCMGCGVCVSECPEDAITLQEDPTKAHPLLLL